VEPNQYNTGFQLRNKWFREGYVANGPYRPEGATFIAPLQHDLTGCGKSLPPGI